MASSVETAFPSPDCSLDGQTSAFLARVYLAAAFPPLLIISVGLCTALVNTIAFACNNRTVPAATKRLLKGSYASCVILLLMSHTFLTRKVFELIQCRVMGLRGGKGQTYLVQDADIACGESTHILLTTLIAVPMFVLYVLGIPTFCLYQLWRRKASGAVHSLSLHMHAHTRTHKHRERTCMLTYDVTLLQKRYSVGRTPPRS